MSKYYWIKEFRTIYLQYFGLHPCVCPPPVSPYSVPRCLFFLPLLPLQILLFALLSWYFVCKNSMLNNIYIQYNNKLYNVYYYILCNLVYTYLDKIWSYDPMIDKEYALKNKILNVSFINFRWKSYITYEL